MSVDVLSGKALCEGRNDRHFYKSKVNSHKAKVECELLDLVNSLQLESEYSRREEAERALVEATIPLEVLHGQDQHWMLGPCARRYRKMISEGLRDQIALSVHTIRSYVSKYHAP
jgi:hypothetical protein